MSTRAMYTFTDSHETIHVYKHSDGYPEGALSWIANALHYAWPLPRFEASDFAAAFVAANKKKLNPADQYPRSGGEVRLCNVEHARDYAIDAEYWYVVSATRGPFNANPLHVKVYETSWLGDHPTENLIFSGPLDDAIRQYKPEWIEPLPTIAAA